MKKKKIILIVLLAITLIGIPASVFAKEDLGFYAGDKLTVKKEKNSTIFAAGNTVNLESPIDGMSFTAGQNINIKSSQDHIFTAGKDILLENAQAKEVFIAGQKISIENSELRDVFIAGENITFESTKARNAYITGNKVVIDSTFDGNVTVAADRIVITDNAVINGTLKYPKESSADISKKSVISKTKTYTEKTEKTVKTTNKSSLPSTLYSIASMIVIAIILLATNKKMFKNIAAIETNASKLITTMLKGFGVLFLVPFVVLFLMISYIGLPVGLITLALYVILIYVSMIPTAYYLGKWILKDSIDNDYALMAISISALYLLRLVPVIGGLITFATLLFGLGAYFTIMKDTVIANNSSKKKETKKNEIEEATVEEVKEEVKKEKKETKTKSTKKK